MTEPAILAIYGRGEAPEVFKVDRTSIYSPEIKIERIERRDENFGTYGIAWFDVFAAGQIVASLNALDVAAVKYRRAKP